MTVGASKYLELNATKKPRDKTTAPMVRKMGECSENRIWQIGGVKAVTVRVASAQTLPQRRVIEVVIRSAGGKDCARKQNRELKCLTEQDEAHQHANISERYRQDPAEPDRVGEGHVGGYSERCTFNQQKKI